MDSIINKSDQFQLHNAQWGALSYHDYCDNQPFDTFIVSSYVMVKNCFKQAKWLSICYPEEGIILVRICKVSSQQLNIHYVSSDIATTYQVLDSEPGKLGAGSV